MNLKIQSVKFNADERLLEFIEGKMAKLEHFVDRMGKADVILKLDTDHEKGNKVVTIRAEVPGGELVTEQRSRTFEEAVDNGLEVLKRQIEKHKEKFR